eukprot:TRINITY_DN20165_c0_g1_i1.p1 TRINITY_DN20165_c0_g1~~TRINITY_DN20165_c0_g1_i1.p1  ORF type:complete len:259 (+),score=33.41 TRINITY_DN20165_c0_g1_i1:37-813(+)
MPGTHLRKYATPFWDSVGTLISMIGLFTVMALPVSMLLIIMGRSDLANITIPLAIVPMIFAKLCVELQRYGVRRGGHMTWFASRLTLWPTVAMYAVMDTIGVRQYYDEVHKDIFVGGAPYDSLAVEFIQKHSINTVINCCEEYPGPISIYEQHGVSYFNLNCLDFCDVPLDKIEATMQHLSSLSEPRPIIYIHCKAGKGRAVTIATAWLALKHLEGDTKTANEQVKKARPSAISSVHLRPDMLEYAAALRARLGKQTE